MKAIVAKEQVKLGPWRCLQLSMTGMSFRMFRSMITVSILALAVAFLTHMIGFGLISHETKLAAFRELQDKRLFGEWHTRLSVPDPESEIVAHLAGKSSESELRRKEYVSWAAAGPEESRRLQETALLLKKVQDYFLRLPVSTRVVLTGGLDAGSDLSLTRELESPAKYDLFSKRLDELGLKSPLGERLMFQRLIREEMPWFDGELGKIREGHRRAISKIRVHYPESETRMLLAEPPEGFTEVLVAAGFHPKALSLGHLLGPAQDELDEERLGRGFALAGVRSALAKKIKKKASEVDTVSLLQWMKHREQAVEVAAILGKEAPGPERLFVLAENKRRLDLLQDIAGNEVMEERESLLSLDAGTRWLIYVSFLVCAVGVANAMLMSVTERFSEIATMKCLGALNGFIMQVFFFEALLQGLVGGLMGLFAGLLLAGFRGLVEFGFLAFASIPWGDLMLAAFLAWMAGLLLAAAAAVGPVWVAARLAPMEAMRVE